MGKWDKHIAGLPRYNVADPSYQERIDAVKSLILDPPSRQTKPVPNEMLSVKMRVKDAMARAHDCLLNATGGKRYASTFASGYRDARELKGFLEEQVKNVDLFVEAYTSLFANQIEVEGSKSLKLKDETKVRIQYEPYAQVEDREAYHEWCKQNGHEREMSLPWATTNALTKERLESGEALPIGIKLWNRVKIVLSK